MREAVLLLVEDLTSCLEASSFFVVFSVSMCRYRHVVIAWFVF
jgi:hypothetical protein